jgi:hypothetical protein
MKKSKPKPVKPATATEAFDKLTPDIGYLPPKLLSPLHQL